MRNRILLLTLAAALLLLGRIGQTQAGNLPILSVDQPFGQLEVAEVMPDGKVQVSNQGWVLGITQGPKTLLPWKFKGLAELRAKYPNPYQVHSLRVTQRAQTKGGYSFYSLADRLKDPGDGTRLQVISLSYPLECKMEHYRRNGKREYVWGYVVPGEPLCARYIRTEVYVCLVNRGQLGVTLRRFYQVSKAFRCDNRIVEGNIVAVDWQGRVPITRFEREADKIVRSAEKTIESRERQSGERQVVQYLNPPASLASILVPAPWGSSLATQGMESSTPIYLGSVEYAVYDLPQFNVNANANANANASASATANATANNTSTGKPPTLPPPPGVTPPGTPPNPDEHYPTPGDVDGRPKGDPNGLPNANTAPPSLPPP